MHIIDRYAELLAFDIHTKNSNRGVQDVLNPCPLFQTKLCKGMDDLITSLLTKGELHKLNKEARLIYRKQLLKRSIFTLSKSFNPKEVLEFGVT